METYMSVLAIAGVLVTGSMSPGPSFLFVARNAIALSRSHGFATALGMGSGVFIFSIVALLGLHAVFTSVPVAFWVLKIAGGGYLMFLAVGILRSARQPLSQHTDQETTQISLGRAYTLGLFTQMSNPKTAIVFAGIFSGLLPQQVPVSFYVLIPTVAFCIDAGWYFIVAVALSTESPRKTFLRYKAVFDSVAGCVLGVLGVKLMLSCK